MTIFALFARFITPCYIAEVGAAGAIDNIGAKVVIRHAQRAVFRFDAALFTL